MKRFPLLLVAALIGVAVSAPAQRTSNSRQSRGAVATSQQSQRGQIVNRAAPSRSARSTNSARSATLRHRASSSRSTRPVARTTPVRSARSARSSQIGYVGHNGQGNRSRTVARVARNVARVARSIPVPTLVGFGHNNHSYNRGHGHWITRCEQVLVPGYWDVDYHAAVYGWVYDSCGYRVWGVSEPAYNHRFWVPARYETRTRQVWVRH